MKGTYEKSKHIWENRKSLFTKKETTTCVRSILVQNQQKHMGNNKTSKTYKINTDVQTSLAMGPLTQTSLKIVVVVCLVCFVLLFVVVHVLFCLLVLNQCSLNICFSFSYVLSFLLFCVVVYFCLLNLSLNSLKIIVVVCFVCYVCLLPPLFV